MRSSRTYIQAARKFNVVFWILTDPVVNSENPDPDARPDHHNELPATRTHPPPWMQAGAVIATVLGANAPSIVSNVASNIPAAVSEEDA